MSISRSATRRGDICSRARAWVANFLDRTKVMILPLLTLLIPLFRILPPTYRWRMRSKFIRFYKDLSRLEEELRDRAPGDSISAFAAELDRIEDEVRELQIPPGYLDSVYALRLHIDLVRAEVANTEGQELPQDTGKIPG
jgi:hypothetical protein